MHNLLMNEDGAEFALNFMHKVLGVRTWSKTEEIVRALFNEEVSTVVVQSCTGAGKTKAAADIAIAYLMTAPDRTVITTAPTYRQVSELLWKEIRKTIRKCESRGIKLGGNLPPKATRYEIRDGWLMIGFSSNDDVGFQGWHSEGGTLAIIDEGVGVRNEVWEALEGTLTGANDRLLALANPTIASGRFFDLTKSQNSKSIYKIKISAFDVPNVSMKELPIVGLTTQKFIDDKKEQWGEESALYKARILGEFPESDDHSLVPVAWVDAAVERWRAFAAEEINEKKIIDITAGLDVARLGIDRTILAVAKHINDGRVVVNALDKLPKSDTMKTAAQAVTRCNTRNVKTLNIDADGIGAGVYDRANELCNFAIEYRGGRTANNPTKFFNLRSEAIFSMRTLLHPESKLKIALPPDDDLTYQLTSIRYEELSDGRIKLESKDEWRKRTKKHSTDELDAVAMCLARIANDDVAMLERAYG